MAPTYLSHNIPQSTVLILKARTLREQKAQGAPDPRAPAALEEARDTHYTEHPEEAPHPAFFACLSPLCSLGCVGFGVLGAFGV